LWLDIEGSWPHDIPSNVEFLKGLADAITGHGLRGDHWVRYSVDITEGGIYCGREWPKIFGNFSGLSDWPLWYAHYDLIPSFVDWFGQPYGGWKVHYYLVSF